MAKKTVTTGPEQGHERTREKGGGFKAKAGVQTGCKLAFGFAEPRFHAGFKPSFKRFHTDHEKVQRFSRSDS